jgi:hypothetical protein
VASVVHTYRGLATNPDDTRPAATFYRRDGSILLEVWAMHGHESRPGGLPTWVEYDERGQVVYASVDEDAFWPHLEGPTDDDVVFYNHVERRADRIKGLLSRIEASLDEVRRLIQEL